MVIMDRKLKLKVCSSLYFARTMWPFHCICTTMPRPEFYIELSKHAMQNIFKHDRIFHSGASGFQWWLETFGLCRLHFPASLVLRVCNDALPWLEVPCFSGRLVEPKKSPEFFFFSSLFFLSSFQTLSQNFSTIFQRIWRNPWTFVAQMILLVMHSVQHSLGSYDVMIPAFLRMWRSQSMSPSKVLRNHTKIHFDKNKWKPIGIMKYLFKLNFCRSRRYWLTTK